MKLDIYSKLENYTVILASGSPRRQQLLSDLGIEFSVEPVNLDESYPEHLRGEEVAVFLARSKAYAYPISEREGNPLIITADTIVWLDDHLLGKPDNFEEGMRILKELSGKMHQVFTGVCFRTKRNLHSFVAVSDVCFKELDDNEIKWYLTKYCPYDKAGAYGVQEWIGYIGIERIEGSYFNVMGLPTQLLWNELQTFISRDYHS